jgi:DNA-binding Lrp family transcriptional regulator
MAEFEPLKSKDRRNYCVLPIRATIDQELIKTAAFTVLARICTYIDRTGKTYVSQIRLADELGVSRQAINKQMKRLRDLGYIKYAKPEYKGQRTTSIRVIFDIEVETEEEAYSNLTASEQMEVAEKRKLEELRRATERNNKNLQPNQVSHTKLDMQPNRVSPPATSEVAPPETSRGCTNVPTNEPINVYKESIKRMMTEYCDTAEKLGQTRIINERDQILLQGWIESGLTFITWQAIIARHATWCKENRREFAKTLAYFRNPVERELERAGHPDIKRLVNGIMRSNKM